MADGAGSVGPSGPNLADMPSGRCAPSFDNYLNPGGPACGAAPGQAAVSSAAPKETSKRSHQMVTLLYAEGSTSPGSG